MAFALIGYKAFPIVHDGAQRNHARQVMVLNITAANTDTALDISSDTAGSLGTFWTAVLADASFGPIGTNALAFIQAIVAGNVVQLMRATVPLTFLRVASGASGSQYTQTITGQLPSIAFVSGSAPTAYKVELEWLIHDGQSALNQDFGAAF